LIPLFNSPNSSHSCNSWQKGSLHVLTGLLDHRLDPPRGRAVHQRTIHDRAEDADRGRTGRIRRGIPGTHLAPGLAGQPGRPAHDRGHGVTRPDTDPHPLPPGRCTGRAGGRRAGRGCGYRHLVAPAPVQPRQEHRRDYRNGSGRATVDPPPVSRYRAALQHGGLVPQRGSGATARIPGRGPAGRGQSAGHRRHCRYRVAIAGVPAGRHAAPADALRHRISRAQ